MTQTNEIEQKILLTKSQFKAITQTYPQVKTLTQTNYYFDSKDFFLRSQKIGLRVRVFLNQNLAEQTLKIPNKSQSLHHDLTEITDQITYKEVNKIVSSSSWSFSGEVGQYLKTHFDKINFVIFAKATTNRKLLLGPLNTEITLDETIYPDKLFDYELEIENNNPKLIQQVTFVLKEKFNLSFDQPVINKVQRALDHR